MTGFVAHTTIKPTLEWQTEIERALATCDVLVALLHEKYKESDWCDQEVGYALGRSIPVFAVKYGCDPYGFVNKFQGFEGDKKNVSEIAKEIFETSITHKKLQSKMSEILVKRFAESGSFAAAKNRVRYLEMLEVWDPKFNQIIEEATQNNSQINSSWGVPNRVEALIKKWSNS